MSSRLRHCDREASFSANCSQISEQITIKKNVASNT